MNLKIKLLPYEHLGKQSFGSMVKDLQESTLILIDAKLTPEEEAYLIEETMKKINPRFLNRNGRPEIQAGFTSFFRIWFQSESLQSRILDNNFKNKLMITPIAIIPPTTM